MESYLQRKRHNINEISKEVSHAVTGVGQKDLRRRQEAATFFHEVLGWDVVKGVSPGEIDRVLQGPQNFGIKITEVLTPASTHNFARPFAVSFTHALLPGGKGSRTET